MKKLVEELVERIENAREGVDTVLWEKGLDENVREELEEVLGELDEALELLKKLNEVGKDGGRN